VSTFREEIQNKRKNIIVELLEKKPMRWYELAKNLVGKNRWFKIDRDLSKTLKSLMKEDKIVKTKLSHKKVIYMLTEDAKIYMKTWNALKQKEASAPKVWEEIRKSKTELTSEQAKNWIVALMFFGLDNFLNGLEHVVRAEEKWVYYARWMLDHFIDTFGTQLLMLGKTYPDLMDSAIETVKKRLEALTLSHAPKIWEVPTSGKHPE